MNKTISIERVKATAHLQGHRLSESQVKELIGIVEAGYVADYVLLKEQNKDLNVIISELSKKVDEALEMLDDGARP